MHAFLVHRIIGGNQTCQRKGSDVENEPVWAVLERINNFEQPENY